MSGRVDPTVLQRMVSAKAAAPTEVPVTASRAMRLSMSRAAQRTVGLELTVLGVGEETLPLEDLLGTLNNENLLLKLHQKGATAGVIALDRGLISAVIEMLATGQLSQTPPESRPVTLADQALIEPFLTSFLAQLAETTEGTALDGWVTGVSFGDRYNDSRSVGLILPHTDYKVMRLTLDLDGKERQGEVLMALPSSTAPVKLVTPTVEGTWQARLTETVMNSPAALTAMLHRFDMSLKTATHLHVGQVVPLPGCTVSSVQLLGADGARVARAKLGQVAGHIAVRLEDPLSPELSALRTGRAEPDFGTEQPALDADFDVPADPEPLELAMDDAPAVDMDFDGAAEVDLGDGPDLDFDAGPMAIDLPDIPGDET